MVALLYWMTHFDWLMTFLTFVEPITSKFRSWKWICKTTGAHQKIRHKKRNSLSGAHQNIRHQRLLTQLTGCCPQFQANYENCMRQYRSMNPGKSEIDFLKLVLALKKIELKNEKRRSTDFTVSKAGKQLTLPELRRKLFRLIPWFNKTLIKSLIGLQS